MQLGSGKRFGLAPVIGAIAYPQLISAFQWAVRAYRESADWPMVLLAFLLMLMAVSIPLMSAMALFHMRHQDGPALTRGILYLTFTVPSLFTLSISLSGLAGVGEQLPLIWAAGWGVAAAVVYLRGDSCAPVARGAGVARLRVVHGATALVLLLGFLIAHVINHDLALWSVSLHGTAMDWLRVWYRSAWVEPVLLGLLVVMICTGVPMVAHHSRWRMDAFRVAQLASGVYLGVFLCSHVLATLNARRLGIETGWEFAAGPASLLDGAGLRGRLIPHYFLSTFCLILHVACGLRVVLLQHGVAKVVGNRVFYGLAGVSVVIAGSSLAALLGFHIVGE